MTNVIKLDVLTKLPIDAPDMLRAIADENPQNAMVITWDEDGNATYHSSYPCSQVNTFWAMKFIHKLLGDEFV